MYARSIVSRTSVISWAKPGGNYSIDSSSDEDDEDDQDSRAPGDFLEYFDVENSLSDKEEDPVKKVIRVEAYCLDPVSFAQKFIDAILSEANTEVQLRSRRKGANCLLDRSRTSQNFSSQGTISTYELEPKITHSWPFISQFNIKAGQETLENYVSQWQRSEDWYFCVEFLGFESEDCSNVFVYEVEWSKPTMSYPIPQVTASVFFAMEVFKMIPHTHDRPIEVSYIFECSTVIHKPGKNDFQEKWLEDIINAKLKFFKLVTFAVSVV